MTPRWLVLVAIAGSAALVASCLSVSTPDTTGPPGSSTTFGEGSTTFMGVASIVFQAEWEPANDATAMSEAVAALDEHGVMMLVPRDILEGSESSALLWIKEGGPPPALSSAVLFMTLTLQGDELSLSLDGRPVASGLPTCDDRAWGASGEVWQGEAIRGAQGCGATNLVGLGYAEWQENGYRFHLETMLPLDDALTWLATWELVP